ncbi:TPT1 [Bugula neritina]|uniref:TPT1 n=1 Tax=Bugula neritina TaxID=10212 RepID=A0A7J7KQM2_BUGNE|nr:TPT1 [Bugula neritina]
MIIYKDIISGDELFTDAFKFKVENGIIEMDTRKISKKADDIDDSLIGGNASAEEAAEETESATETGYEIVLANKLQQMPPFDKKGYLVRESTNPDGMQVLIDYREDGITPFAIFFEEGLEAEKA